MEEWCSYEEVRANFEGTTEAIVLTEPLPPFLILDVNPAWMNLCGYTREEVIGRSFRFMQGALTDSAVLDEVVLQANAGRRFETILINYKKNGVPFHNYLRIQPLYSNRTSTLVPEITHYLGIFQELPSS